MNKIQKDKQLTPEQIASASLLSYVGLEYPKYIAEPMHKLIATALEKVDSGELRRLVICTPPQHGKPIWQEEQVLMGDGSYKKLKDIEVGDYVITHRKRPRKVLKVYEQGELPTIQLNTRSERNPCAAKDHPFLTIGGWIEAGKLKINDSLAIVRQSDVEYHSHQKTILPTAYAQGGIVSQATINMLLGKMNSTETLIPLKKGITTPIKWNHNDASYYLPDTIISIEDTGLRKCRCLFVEEDHTFTVQNIVVHNTFLTSEFFPAWFLGRHPDWSIIAVTYNQTRANQVGGVVRNNLTSPIHGLVFPNCTISQDTKSVHHVATTQKGHYYSMGVGGSVMGRSAHLVLIDDPLKGREDAESKLVREKMKEWYAASIYTRLRPDNRIVIISTRWHREDLTGYLLSAHPQENWKVIELRAIAEEDDILKRNVGEALCPNIYPLEHLEKVKIIEGSYNWESLYQQRPIARKGGIIQYDWIENNYYEKPPEEKDIEKIVISWDTAYRAEEMSDPTAGTVWWITKNHYYLIDVINERLEFYKIIQKIKQAHETYKPSVHLIEGRASGQPIIDELKRTTLLPIVEVSTKNLDKHIRLNSTTGLFEAGKVRFPDKSPWLIETKDQLCLFPSYKYDDIVDSVSQFLNWVNKPRYVPSPAHKLYWK